MSEAEAPKPVSDQEMLERFRNSKKKPACTLHVGAMLTHVDQANRTIGMEFDAKAEFANPTGAIQGGFITAMLDEAMSHVTVIASNVTMNAPTLEMKVSFFRPLFVGKATATARILKWGKSTAFVEAELFDPAGEMVAKASATQTPKLFRKF